MSIVNEGNQYITFDYKNPATGSSFNTLLRNGITPGIYSGGALTKIDNSTVQIAPFVAFLNVGTDKMVRIETRSTVNVAGFDSVNTLLYITYTWSDQIENWLDFATRDPGDPAVTNEVILGKAVYTTPPTMDAVFDYTLLTTVLSTDKIYSHNADKTVTRENTQAQMNKFYTRNEITNSIWVTATAYVIGDKIWNGNTEFRCLSNHTSGTFNTDWASNYWKPIVKVPAGQIVGGIYNSAAPGTDITKIKIRAGSYEIDDGTEVQIATDTPLALTQIIGDQILRPYSWYYVMINKNASIAIQAATGDNLALKYYNITSISGGNTINFGAAIGGTDEPDANMWVVIEGATTSSNNGMWKIASAGGGSPKTSITVDGTLTNQVGAGGTVKVLYGMSTLHGTGVELGITTEADFILYTPSPADAELGFTNDWAWFDLSRNGYYSKYTGYTNYRILGIIGMGASTIDFVISYKSGKNKNDNMMHVHTFASLATNGIRFATILQLWGNDYVYVDHGTVGALITARRNLKASSNFTSYAEPSAVWTMVISSTVWNWIAVNTGANAELSTCNVCNSPMQINETWNNYVTSATSYSGPGGAGAVQWRIGMEIA